jgi:hypothetical protein
MVMGVVVEEARRVIVRQGEAAALSLARSNPQEHIVGCSAGWNVQAVVVQIRWLSQAVVQLDPHRITRLQFKLGARE